MIEGKLPPKALQDGARIPVLNAVCRRLRAERAWSNLLPKGSRKPPGSELTVQQPTHHRHPVLAWHRRGHVVQVAFDARPVQSTRP